MLCMQSTKIPGSTGKCNEITEMIWERRMIVEQRILAYHRYMEEQIEKLEHGSGVCDVERLKQEHLTQIGFFQHERLIHLIVTVLFALLEALSVMIVLISGEVFSVLLPFAVLVLLLPYIRHYYILENEVQYMYRQYDRLNRCHAGSSTAEKEQFFGEK